MPQPANAQPLVSVALSVFNGARFLGEQLDSVLAQRDVPLEVVAVDDGSTDGSLDLLQAYARRDARVRVHANPANLGPTRSFERAMGMARGAFLAPCDQDDRWAPDKLATLLAAIGTHDLAYGDSWYIDEAGRRTGRRISQDLDMLQGTRPLRFAMDNSVSGHALLVRRDLFEQVRPLPPTLYYDWVLAMFAAARHGVVYVDRALVEFRRHGAAYSSLGKASAPGRPRASDRYRRWVADRSALLHALAASPFEADGRAARFAQALDRAIAGDGAGPLLAAVWRERGGLSPSRALSWTHAVRLQLRLLRKLRRAAGERRRAGA